MYRQNHVVEVFVEIIRHVKQLSTECYHIATICCYNHKSDSCRTLNRIKNVKTLANINSDYSKNAISAEKEFTQNLPPTTKNDAK